MTASPRDLAPCPFCGAAPVMEYWHGGGSMKRIVSCQNDSGCEVLPNVTGQSPEKAAAAWNRRAAAPSPAPSNEAVALLILRERGAAPQTPDRELMATIAEVRHALATLTDRAQEADRG